MINFPLSIFKSIFLEGYQFMEQSLSELQYNRGLRQTLLRSPHFFNEDFRVVPLGELLNSADHYLFENQLDIFYQPH